MRKAKIIFLVVLLLTALIYILFVPEFKKSSKADENYIYLISDRAFKNQYLVKNNGTITIDLRDIDTFSLYLPYNHTVAYDWNISAMDDSILKLNKSYIKECRTPIYAWNRDGEDYSMKVFQFSKIKNGTNPITFMYSDAKNHTSFTVTINFNVQ